MISGTFVTETQLFTFSRKEHGWEVDVRPKELLTKDGLVSYEKQLFQWNDFQFSLFVTQLIAGNNF